MNAEYHYRVKSFISHLEKNKDMFGSITPIYFNKLLSSLNEIHNPNLQNEDVIKLSIDAVNQCECILT